MRHPHFVPVFQSTRPHGARPTTSLPRLVFWGFNPRARTGRDGDIYRQAELFEVSIHAPARGATRRGNGKAGNKSFNPRARTGRDTAPIAETAPVKVSIHAPARGATLSSCKGSGIRCFNPRARTGRDFTGFRATSAKRFQSTRPHGARPGSLNAISN